MVYDDEGDPYLEADSKFNKKTIRNPIAQAEDVFYALREIHHENRCHVGRKILFTKFF